ncbi:hypothetical protein BJ508DRAFT_207543 [Ascobolus immersus RN42]|uniref:Peptidase M43 pregnancy-associated plasma-A domain-containing protein n=1 Tax=Ascobolus immersus RN42 TaxID=1160509 RepID=A0A3N4IFU5_ASCIM|nr:hypothetical protein BJ508DRAFT_207543 [Ascobolus immersus RN42]
MSQRSHPSPKRTRTIKIPVYIHVVFGNNSIHATIPNKLLRKQMVVLNEGFASLKPRFKFDLIGITRTNNSGWSRAESLASMLSMGGALRKGNYGTLNIYIVDAYANNKWYGMASPPLMIPWEDEVKTDGVWLDWSTVPGPYANKQFGLGKTAVHEVGHWLGLLHTWGDDVSEGCSLDPYKGGDFVADTPAEREPARGCQIGRDTCRGEGFDGDDPVTNPMDYSDDHCIGDFTPGQARRMEMIWDLLRPVPDAYA